jgi:hypothetical protein
LAPASRADKTFPETREHGTVRTAAVSRRSLARRDRSAFWFRMNQSGGSMILHHRHIRLVLVRGWSTPMDGITATIWASRTTIRLGSLSEELLAAQRGGRDDDEHEDKHEDEELTILA